MVDLRDPRPALPLECGGQVMPFSFDSMHQHIRIRTGKAWKKSTSENWTRLGRSFKTKKGSSAVIRPAGETVSRPRQTAIKKFREEGNEKAAKRLEKQLERQLAELEKLLS
jgi:hypothetical protein